MNGTNYEVPHFGAFSIPHSHPSWAQIFASRSCFQIPLTWIPPLSRHIQNTKLDYLLNDVFPISQGQMIAIRLRTSGFEQRCQLDAAKR